MMTVNGIASVNQHERAYVRDEHECTNRIANGKIERANGLLFPLFFGLYHSIIASFLWEVALFDSRLFAFGFLPPASLSAFLLALNMAPPKFGGWREDVPVAWAALQSILRAIPFAELLDLDVVAPQLSDEQWKQVYNELAKELLAMYGSSDGKYTLGTEDGDELPLRLDENGPYVEYCGSKRRIIWSDALGRMLRLSGTTTLTPCLDMASDMADLRAMFDAMRERDLSRVLDLATKIYGVYEIGSLCAVYVASGVDPDRARVWASALVAERREKECIIQEKGRIIRLLALRRLILTRGAGSCSCGTCHTAQSGEDEGAGAGAAGAAGAVAAAADPSSRMSMLDRLRAHAASSDGPFQAGDEGEGGNDV